MISMPLAIHVCILLNQSRTGILTIYFLYVMYMRGYLMFVYVHLFKHFCHRNDDGCHDFELCDVSMGLLCSDCSGIIT